MTCERDLAYLKRRGFQENFMRKDPFREGATKITNIWSVIRARNSPYHGL